MFVMDTTLYTCHTHLSKVKVDNIIPTTSRWKGLVMGWLCPEALYVIGGMLLCSCKHRFWGGKQHHAGWRNGISRTTGSPHTPHCWPDMYGGVGPIVKSLLGTVQQGSTLINTKNTRHKKHRRITLRRAPVRTLCGQSVNFEPLGQLRRSFLSRKKKRLQPFGPF